MVSKAGRYGINIGTGAASGAALGTSILPGWGTAIGGVLGAGAGAISAAVQNGDEDDERDKLKEQQAQELRHAQIMFLRNQALKYGGDTTLIDAGMAREGMDMRNAAQDEQFERQHDIDPNAFVSMATNGARAAGGIYKAANAPQAQQPLQLTEIPTLQDPGQYSDYQIDPERMRYARGLA